MSALDGNFSSTVFDSSLSHDASRLFEVLPTSVVFDYSTIHTTTHSGKNMVQSINIVDYDGTEADVEPSQENISKNVKGTLKAVKKEMTGTGTIEPGLVAFKKPMDRIFSNKDRHVQAHDPAHRLRSNVR